MTVLITSVGCQDLSGTQNLPAGVQGPDAFHTASGAVQMARGAVNAMAFNLLQIVEEVGEFTDELAYVNSAASGPYPGFVDSRRVSEHPQRPNGNAYGLAHVTRGQARLARAALAAYAPSSPLSLQALMYALEGYAEILLADHYCSGIPLSTVDFPEGVTLKAGSTTAEVYQHAAELLDSAILLAVGNDSITYLARVGLGRALLGQKLYDSAASVVAAVPDTFIYRVAVRREGGYANLTAVWPLDVVNSTVGDREGRNGLPFVSSHDPRTMTVSTVVRVSGGLTQYVADAPIKYIGGGRAELVLTSGVEARLITAEADLARGGSQWLAVLNRLRTSGTTTITIRTDVPGVSPGPAGYPDTTWGAGTGVGLIAPSVVADVNPICPFAVPCTDTVWYRGLRPLSDPGVSLSPATAAISRVDLLFQERAFWLFLTGHRHGDLRRLIRQYGRNSNTVFPTGVHQSPRLTYGTEVVYKIFEYSNNPFYKGCFHYGA